MARDRRSGHIHQTLKFSLELQAVQSQRVATVQATKNPNYDSKFAFSLPKFFKYFSADRRAKANLLICFKFVERFLKWSICLIRSLAFCSSRIVFKGPPECNAAWNTAGPNYYCFLLLQLKFTITLLFLLASRFGGRRATGVAGLWFPQFGLQFGSQFDSQFRKFQGQLGRILRDFGWFSSSYCEVETVKIVSTMNFILWDVRIKAYLLERFIVF